MLRLPSLTACALAAATALCAHATDVPLPTDRSDAAYGDWSLFNVSDIDSQTFGVEWIDNANTNSPSFGSPLNFVFTIAAGAVGRLTVVDGGFAGDTFNVTNNGSLLGATSPVQNTELIDIGYDFDVALVDPNVSQGVFTLAAGSYRIGGELLQSLVQGGVTLNSTVGAVSLATIPAIPEPATLAMLLAGLALLLAAKRRGR